MADPGELLGADGGFHQCKRCRHGYMLYNIHDTHIGKALHHYGEWAEAEMALLGAILQEGSVVLDVGANIGTHSVFFGNAVGQSGKVLAFEPQRILFQALCANAAINSLTNIFTFNTAVGAGGGNIKVPSIDYNQPSNFGGVSLLHTEEGASVPVLGLDELLLPGCNLIKIDVEGMELDVVNGAVKLIQSCKPVLYVENNDNDRSPALIARLQELGYHLYWHFSPFYSPENYFGNEENVLGHWVNTNVLAVPMPVDGLLDVTGVNDTAEAALERLTGQSQVPD